MQFLLTAETQFFRMSDRSIGVFNDCPLSAAYAMANAAFVFWSEDRHEVHTSSLRHTLPPYPQTEAAIQAGEFVSKSNG